MENFAADLNVPGAAAAAPGPGVAPVTPQHVAQPPVVTSSGKKKKRKSSKATQIGKNKRVCIQRRQLTAVSNVAQKGYIPPEAPNKAKFYGTVKGGDSKAGWKIDIDIFPENIGKSITAQRSRIHKVLTENEEEPQGWGDEPEEDEEETDEVATTAAASAAEFCAQSKDHLKTAKECKINYKLATDKKDDPTRSIVWDIAQGGEEITQCSMGPVPPVKIAPQVENDMVQLPFHEFFFKHIFPDVTGVAMRIDEYLSDPRASYHQTYVNRNVKFNVDGAADPDRFVKLCLRVLIAAASEVESGIDSLWMRGRSGGRRDYPDFGQYVEKNTFKMFCSALPFAWADKTLWFMDTRDLPWDVFMPVLGSFNEKRKHLFVEVISLMLDESMSGWRPKTSKLGGLPNISFEPRKPVPLGTMFKDAAECDTGAKVFADVVQNPEAQKKKAFYGEPSHLPGKPPISSHTAEVLRQVSESGCTKWVGGDAWFGSVSTAVEVKKRMNVDSTWILKNNTSLFPKQQLLAVLKARNGEHIAGTWVHMTTTIEGVRLIALAYAWSKKGVSYFISTCGRTIRAKKMYRSCFEDDFGQATYKELPRPELADFLYVRLPLIDEHNKQRQSCLALEKSWPTKCCWFRLMTTLLGICVVDMHMLYSYKYESKYLEMDIRKFADLLTGKLPFRLRTVEADGVASAPEPLVRIGIKDVTEKQQGERDTGSSKQARCFVCRRYQRKAVWTSFMCSICGTPICKKDRSKDAQNRTCNCLEEHLSCRDPQLSCTAGVQRKKMPTSKLLY